MLARLLRGAASALAEPPLILRESGQARIIGAAAGAMSYGDGLAPPQSLSDYLELADSLVAVRHCVDLNARGTASAILRFRERDDEGDEGDEELSPKHPLQRLFRHVNPEITYQTLIAETVMALDYTGNAYWELVRAAPRKGKRAALEVGGEWLPGTVIDMVWDRSGTYIPMFHVDGLGALEVPPAAVRGEVIEIWPMRPDRVKIDPDPAGGIRSFTYTIGQQKLTLHPGNVLHFKYPSLTNDYYGSSPLFAARRDIVSDALQARADNALNANAGRPSGIMLLEDDIDDDHMKTLRRMIDAEYSGPQNAGKIMLLKHGRKFESLTMSSLDRQAIENRRWNREQILHALDVPAFVYGIRDASATRDNVWAEERQHLTQALMPRGQLIAGTITETLLPRIGMGDLTEVYAEMDFAAHPAMKELAAQEGRANAALVAQRILRPNDVRQTMRLDPIEGGDLPLLDASMVAAVGRIVQSVANQWIPRGSGIAQLVACAGYTEDEAEVILDDAGTDEFAPAGALLPPMPGEIVLPTEGQPDEGVDEGNQPTVEAGIKTSDSALNGAQVTAATAIVQSVANGQLPRDSAIGQLMVFFNLSKEEAEAILGSVGTDAFKPAAPYDPADAPPPAPASDKEATKAAPPYTRASPFDDILSALDLPEDDPLLVQMRNLYREILIADGEAALTEIGVRTEFNADTPALRKWLEEKVITFADATTETTKERLRATLLEGHEAGETYVQLADRVREAFDGRRDNALTVARTEVAGAAAKGRMESYEQAGIEEHQWLTSRDEHVRDSHAALDAETVKIGEPFSNGLEFPGDTAHGGPEDWANERCTVVAVVPGGSAPLKPHDPDETSAPPPVTRAYTEEERTAIWRKFATRTEPKEKAVARQWVKMLAAQERRVLAGLKG